MKTWLLLLLGFFIGVLGSALFRGPAKCAPCGELAEPIVREITPPAAGR